MRERERERERERVLNLRKGISTQRSGIEGHFVNTKGCKLKTVFKGKRYDSDTVNGAFDNGSKR